MKPVRASQGALSPAQYVGDVLVGDDWGAAGAVIGASGPRSSKSTISEDVKTLWSVDVYTKIPGMTLYTVDFDTDGNSAKKFYSVVANAVPN